MNWSLLSNNISQRLHWTASHACFQKVQAEADVQCVLILKLNTIVVSGSIKVNVT